MVFEGAATRDLKSISLTDWVVYVTASLFLLAAIFASVEGALIVDRKFAIIALSAAFTFGIVIENGWHHRKSMKFWLVLVCLLVLHFVILFYKIPPSTSFPMLLVAPVSFIEVLISVGILRRFGFGSALLLRYRKPQSPIPASRSVLKVGVIIFAVSSVLLLLLLRLRTLMDPDAVAALIYVFGLSAISGVGVIVVGLVRAALKLFRHATTQ